MPLRSGLFPGLVLVAAVLAGCSNSPQDANTADGTGSGSQVGANGQGHLVAPNWTLGDWWTLDSSQLGPYTNALSGESGDQWTMDTDNQEIAFFDARFDASFLGNVRKSDLAGSQGSDVVQYFQFPLTLGKNWTTQWDGAAIDIEVTEVANGVAKLTAQHANGTLFATYSYDSKPGYFRDYTFYEADGVTVSFEARLTASGKAFQGELVRWSLTTLDQNTGTGPAQGGTAPFTVAAGTTDLWLAFHMTCSGNAGFLLTIAPADAAASSQAFSINGPCTGAFDVEGVIVEGPVAGTWGYVREFGGGPEPPTASTLLLGRTLEIVPMA